MLGIYLGINPTYMSKKSINRHEIRTNRLAKVLPSIGTDETEQNLLLLEGMGSLTSMR
jgi:hypothetical protein